MYPANKTHTFKRLGNRKLQILSQYTNNIELSQMGRQGALLGGDQPIVTVIEDRISSIKAGAGGQLAGLDNEAEGW